MEDGLTRDAVSNTLNYDNIEEGFSMISVDIIDAVTGVVGEHIDIALEVLSYVEYLQLELDVTDSSGMLSLDGGDYDGDYSPDFSSISSSC